MNFSITSEMSESTITKKYLQRPVIETLLCIDEHRLLFTLMRGHPSKM